MPFSPSTRAAAAGVLTLCAATLAAPELLRAQAQTRSTPTAPFTGLWFIWEDHDHSNYPNVHVRHGPNPGVLNLAPDGTLTAYNTSWSDSPLMVGRWTARGGTAYFSAVMLSSDDPKTNWGAAPFDRLTIRGALHLDARGTLSGAEVAEVFLPNGKSQGLDRVLIDKGWRVAEPAAFDPMGVTLTPRPEVHEAAPQGRQ
ncbi:hypothetical protein [Deinococcus apachensis]|uniref:hypothetical protein n=1 Tax=Deinococcus apachensis TaxID=309886 RepID=UPI000373F91A|nr:hypothetical protein [Deinococcus apachensis]